MGIRFTDDQRRLFLVLTGMEPPELDPSGLRAVADGFTDVVALLAGLQDRLAAAVRGVRTQFSGVAAEAFEHSMADFMSGPTDYVGTAREAASSVARYARSAATDFEYVTYMAIGQIVQLVVEIIWCIVNAFRTFGVSLTLIPVYRAISSAFLRKLLRFLITHLTVHAVIEVGVSLTLDLLIQRIQIGRGSRDRINGELTKEAAVGGAIGGVLSGGAAAAIGRLMRLFRHGAGDLVRLSVRDQVEGLGAGPGVVATSFSDDVAGIVTRNHELLHSAIAGSPGPLLDKAAGTRLGGQFAHLFGNHFGHHLGNGAARELGAAYGETVAKYWGRPRSAQALATLLTRPGNSGLNPGIRSVLALLPGTVLEAARSQHRTLSSTLASLGLDSITSGATEYVAGLFSGLATTGEIDPTGLNFVAGTLNSAVTGVSATTAISTIENLTSGPRSAVPHPTRTDVGSARLQETTAARTTPPITLNSPPGVHITAAAADTTDRKTDPHASATDSPAYAVSARTPVPPTHHHTEPPPATDLPGTRHTSTTSRPLTTAAVAGDAGAQPPHDTVTSPSASPRPVGTILNAATGPSSGTGAVEPSGTTPRTVGPQGSDTPAPGNAVVPATSSHGIREGEVLSGSDDMSTRAARGTPLDGDSEGGTIGSAGGPVTVDESSARQGAVPFRSGPGTAQSPEPSIRVNGPSLRSGHSEGTSSSASAAPAEAEGPPGPVATPSELGRTTNEPAVSEPRRTTDAGAAPGAASRAPEATSSEDDLRKEGGGLAGPLPPHDDVGTGRRYLGQEDRPSEGLARTMRAEACRREGPSPDAGPGGGVGERDGTGPDGSAVGPGPEGQATHPAAMAEEAASSRDRQDRNLVEPQPTVTQAQEVHRREWSDPSYAAVLGETQDASPHDLAVPKHLTLPHAFRSVVHADDDRLHPLPSRSTPSEHAAARLRGGASDLIGEWPGYSSVPGRRRSTELRQIDAAVRLLSAHRNDSSLLDATLRAISAWQAMKGGSSRRWAAVEDLKNHIENLRSETAESAEGENRRALREHSSPAESSAPANMPQTEVPHAERARAAAQLTVEGVDGRRGRPEHTARGRDDRPGSHEPTMSASTATMAAPAPEHLQETGTTAHQRSDTDDSRVIHAQTSSIAETASVGSLTSAQGSGEQVTEGQKWFSALNPHPPDALTDPAGTALRANDAPTAKDRPQETRLLADHTGPHAAGAPSAHNLPARLTDHVATFGSRRTGVQNLVNVTPIPRHVVEWLQQRVITVAEQDGHGDDPNFNESVRRLLTARLLTAEWACLFSTAGLPLNVTRHGQRYPVSLRLSLRDPVASPQQLDPMPDGPPVGIQRWAFGIGEGSDTAGSGDLRTVSGRAGHSWDVERTGLRRIALAPRINLTYNQLTTGVTVGKTVQSMVMIRSKGRSWPFDYVMDWEVRRNVGTTSAVLEGKSAREWVGAGETPHSANDPAGPGVLTVWFPAYLATPQPEAALEAAGPKNEPAPLDRLVNELPLFGSPTFMDYDTLFSDVLSAFPEDLGSLSSGSVDELYEFLKEGNQRAGLSQAWGGTVASPTLYTDSGTVVGYLRLTVELSGGTTRTGPMTASSVMDAYVTRSLRVQGSTRIAHVAGATLPVRLALSSAASSPVDGTDPLGASVNFQAGFQHQFSHTLVSGGSARTARSLRSAEPQLHVTPEMTVSVSLVRPDSRPLPPSAGSPLATGKRYQVGLLVPSRATLGQEPTEPRHLPPEVMYLQQLGVSTTPLQVAGTEALFHRAEGWLRDNGFLPSDRPGTGLWGQVTGQAADTHRLANLRKLDQMRSRHGLRSALDEMIEGGDSVAFELPTRLGTHRATVLMTAERRYTEQDDGGGIIHERVLPGVHTMNYVGSTTAGDEQFQNTPLAWNLGGGASVVNPFGSGGDTWFKELGLRYAYNSQATRTTGASAGVGQEHYMLSPTSNGSQVFSVPVTYRMQIFSSHGTGLASHAADGTVRLAIPTYRTLDEPHSGPRPGRSTSREAGEADIQLLGRPGAARPEGVLRLPDTAVLDRVPGSFELRGIIHKMFRTMDQDAARQDEEAWRNRTPMPGSYPEGELEEHSGSTHADTAPEVPSENSPDPQPAIAVATSMETETQRTVGGLFADTAQWVRGQVSGLGRWLGQSALGEPATNPDSLARQVIDTAFSPHQMAANALRIFGDSYVVEGAGTSGVLAGTDILVDVQGYLTDVELLPEGPEMDLERWLQSVDAAASTESTSSGHQGTVSLGGQYGDDRFAASPGGEFTIRRDETASSTVNDNTGAFRVTTEDTTPVYRFTAKTHLVVKVDRGRRNLVSGTFSPHPGFSRTQVVEPTQPLEFLVVANDLHNHPELAQLVHAAGRQPPSENPQDQLLPPWFVATGGTIGFGAVSEVRLPGGRSAFADRITALVEREAPGTTRPGHATYVPGVSSRINEHATSIGLRALVNAGPAGHTAFHFVHRSWFGPRLVEVALVARPARHAALQDRRGRLVTATSGLDNLFSHSHGEGAALGAAGATQASRGTTNSGELTFSPVFGQDDNRLRPALSLAARSTWTDTQLSSREQRSWQRTFGNTSEFHIPYEYSATVSSRSLDSTLTGWLAQVVGNSVASAYSLSSALGGLFGRLPNSSAPVRATEPADVTLRFNASETAGSTPAPVTVPHAFTADPLAPPPGPPSPGDGVIDFGVPQDVRTGLDGPAWVPSRPFHVYHFAGIDMLGDALRAVDTSLTREPTPRTNRSAEGILVRLTALAAKGQPTQLHEAGIAPLLGHPGSPGIWVQLTLHSPRIERTSRDTAIDRIEISADGFRTQADHVITTGATFEYAKADPRPGGITVPIGGERTSVGQGALTSSQRRELLRFGTAMVNTKGEGMDGHRVRALALLKIRGPQGTRWVSGDIVFRTTETPPVAEPRGTENEPNAFDRDAFAEKTSEPGAVPSGHMTIATGGTRDEPAQVGDGAPGPSSHPDPGQDRDTDG
ncbi:hypothetical protein [Streptomyces sp. ADI93-02]|uniref:hypothetical protein n=1 Tax=Streptomyces sp. ADI93-02 TaxID=1522757 RepID=UPI000F5560E0|nr:hypothetical protein [Streptomyces sp. ADI93-02]RPK32527.1 hypothetical protein EES40_36455 [Streptomyces sp. ADI93-02]